MMHPNRGGTIQEMAAKQFYRLEEFLTDYPGMMVYPATEAGLTLKGEFDFTASMGELPCIADSYAVEILVPDGFPEKVPRVTETGGKIPRDGKHHVNPDNTLCLGSPLRLLWKLSKAPTLVGFAEECLVPYLYGISYKLKHGTFPFGELAHGEPGVVTDYLNLLSLASRDQVLHALALLGKKKRLANKQPCPCGCGKRLGSCMYHFKMIELRQLASRPWFRQHLATLESGK